MIRETDVKRIKYVSQFSDGIDEKQVEDIALCSERKNMEAGLTGLLVATGGLFFQILEGPSDAVDETYARISADSRHHDIVLLSTETDVSKRLYPDWAMKTLSLGEASAERLAPIHALIETVMAQSRLTSKLMETIERSVWDEIVHRSARLDRAD